MCLSTCRGNLPAFYNHLDYPGCKVRSQSAGLGQGRIAPVPGNIGVVAGQKDVRYGMSHEYLGSSKLGVLQQPAFVRFVGQRGLVADDARHQP
jgi:hypothetical protein